MEKIIDAKYVKVTANERLYYRLNNLKNARGGNIVVMNNSIQRINEAIKYVEMAEKKVKQEDIMKKFKITMNR